MVNTFKRRSQGVVISVAAAVLLSLGLAWVAPAQTLTIQKVLGVKWATVELAEAIITRELHRTLVDSGDVDVDISVASIQALWKRQLKSFRLVGNHWVMKDGFPVESLTVATPLDMPLLFLPEDPVRLQTKAKFDSDITLDIARLNRFLASPAGAVWAKTLQKDAWASLENIQFSANDKQELAMTGLLAPRWVGQWVKTPVRVVGHIQAHEGKLRFLNPGIQIYQVKDSGHLARLANTLLTQLVNPERYKMEGHNMAIGYRSASVNPKTLRLNVRIIAEYPLANRGEH